MSAPIGGQAVLEGVMMRGSSNWAVAVRKPNGQIAEVCRPIESVMKRHWFFRLPVVRGVVALGESLAIGFRALAISANYAAAEDNEEAETELSRGALVFAFLLAIGFAISLFKVGPALLADLLPISNGFWFVLVEGSIRVTVFVLYLVLISLLPDLRRVFQYHAAEHKAINAFEAGEELEPQTVQRFSLIHPRCGTAFLLWVMVIAIFVFAFFGRPAWYWLIVSRILLLPRDRGARLRADPLRRQAHRQPSRDDAARAGPLAAAPDDARAEPRPARGLDPRPARGACARAERERYVRGSGRGDGLAARAAAAAPTRPTSGIAIAAPAKTLRAGTTANSGETSIRPVACAPRWTSEIRPVTRPRCESGISVCAAETVRT